MPARPSTALPALLLTLVALTAAPASAQSPAGEPGAAAAGLEVRCVRPREVELRWPAAPGAQGYVVWRRAAGPDATWERVEEVERATTPLRDRGLTPRTSVTYRVEPTGGAPGAPSRPVEVLDDFYLLLRGIEQGAAVFTLHKWDAVFSEWLEGTEPFRARAGEPIGRLDLMADLRTDAVVEDLGEKADAPGVQWVRYRTRDGRKVTVTTRDLLPAALRKEEPKRPASAPEEPAAPTRTREPSAAPPPPTTGSPTSLPFPEPKRMGDLPAPKIVWEVVNKTPFDLTIVCEDGGVRRFFKLVTGGTQVVRLPRGGSYSITANAAANRVIPLQGTFSLIGGSHYRSELGVAPATREDMR